MFATRHPTTHNAGLHPTVPAVPAGTQPLKPIRVGIGLLSGGRPTFRFNDPDDPSDIFRQSSLPMEPTGETLRDRSGASNQEVPPSSSAAPIAGATSREDDSSSSSSSRKNYSLKVIYRDDRVDSLARGAYSWVDPEVLKISSVLKSSGSLLGMASAICKPRTWSVTVTACRSGEAVCMSSAEVARPFFYLYDTLHSRLAIHLPFTHFERSVLQTLNVAPTQLHPNSWAFVRAFELLCEDLKRVPTLGVFFWFFTPRKMDKVGWTSLSNRPKRSLLRPFSESYKGFKDRFFRVGPSDPQSEMLVDRDGRQPFPLQWTRRPASSVTAIVKKLEEWERTFIYELKGLPVLRSFGIIKEPGYSIKALAELWKRKKNQVLSTAPTDVETKAAPLSAAGPADKIQTSEEEVSRAPSTLEAGGSVPPSPDRDVARAEKNPAKRPRLSEDHDGDRSVSLEVSAPKVYTPRPRLYQSFIKVADHTIASSSVEAEVDRIGLTGVCEALQQYTAYGFALARVAEKRFGDVASERALWEEQRKSLEEENRKLSSSLAEKETKLREYNLSTAKLQEMLRAEQRSNGELLDTKALLIQAKTDLELGNDALQAEIKKLRVETAAMESAHEEEMKSMEDSLKAAKDTIEAHDRTIHQLGIDVVDQYTVGFARALCQVRFLHPSLDVSDADPFKEIKDGQLVSVMTPPRSPAF
ncbi:hypothetical protein CR513_50571, partial [Mucuna pruriens]